MTDTSETAETETAEVPVPRSLAECRVETLQNGTRLVTTRRPGPDGSVKRLASLRYDSVDHWWRGYWSGAWHFGGLESDLRELLDDDLKAGRVTV